MAQREVEFMLPPQTFKKYIYTFFAVDVSRSTNVRKPVLHPVYFLPADVSQIPV